MDVLFAILAAGAVALIFIGIYLPRSGPDVVEERLMAFTERTRTLEEIELQAPFSERILKPFLNGLAQAIQRAQERNLNPRQENPMMSIQRKLNMAGNPYGWSSSDFLGVKAALTIALAAGLFFLLTVGGKATLGIPAGLVAGLVGWFIPDLLVSSKTGARRHQIVRALPDALDLLVISVEAGLGFDAALQRLVEKTDNPLTREFARVLAELRVGRSRREALRDVIDRTQVQDLTNFISAILQAEQLGVSISKVLTIQADQMRTVRRQRAEQSAAQAPLKMLIPLAIFIFPALCIMILGPIWPTVVQSTAGTPAP
jgi:tight adherence protein C